MRTAGLVIALICTACDKPPPPAPTENAAAREYTLVGSWKIDVDRTLKEIEQGSGSEEERARARKDFADGRLQAAEYEFRGDGTTEVRNRPGEKGPVQGTWKTISREGARWIVEIVDKGETTSAVITWTDLGHITIVEEGKTDVIVLKRK